MFPTEINSNGRLVYGFNWKRTAAGSNTIAFSASNVAPVGADAGELSDEDGDSVYETVTRVLEIGAARGRVGEHGRPAD